MLSIIIIFVTAILAMFTSFLGNVKLIKYISISGLIVSLLLNTFQIHLPNLFPQFWSPNILSQLFSTMSIIIVICIFLISQNAKKSENSTYSWEAFYPLMLFSLSGALLLFGLTNLLTLFLGIEILSIPLYILAASDKDAKKSLEAGLKYFILGSFTSAFLLFGIALCYGTSMVFDIAQFNQLIASNGVNNAIPPYFYIGVGMIMASILFKMSIVPFHFWTPDVYEGSPSLVTTYMATVVKTSASMALFSLMAGFFALLTEKWATILMSLIIMSLLIGNVSALVQKNVKRMMAFSSISHAAFIVLSILLCLVSQNPSIFVIYIMGYIFASLGFFAITTYVCESSDNYSFDSFNGLIHRNKFMTIMATIFILSMAGIPLTAGFLTKYLVIKGVFVISKWYFIATLIASAISIVYYLKVINRMYFYSTSTQIIYTEKSLYFVLLLCALIVIGLGTFPDKVISIFSILK